MLNWIFPAPERRRHPRVRTTGRVEFLTPYEHLTGELVSLSEGGLLMRVTWGAAPRGYVVVRFTVDGFPEKFFAPARVVRVAPDLVAVEFVEKPKVKHVVAALMAIASIAGVPTCSWLMESRGAAARVPSSGAEGQVDFHQGAGVGQC